LASSSYTTNATNVEDSYATGTVTSASVVGKVGGLIGWSQGELTVRSYASGAVNAPAAMAGGFCGTCRQIQNSFSTGMVYGTAGARNGTTGPYRAGLVGLKYTTVTNSYWLKPAGSPLACYGYNDWGLRDPFVNPQLGLGGDIGTVPEVRESAVLSPANMIMLADSRTDTNWDGNIDARQADQWPAKRHGDRTNLQFADGHAEAARRADVVNPRNIEWRRRWNNDNEPHNEVGNWAEDKGNTRD
jgi:prepilin-type processing-associated H-X9-DG protein